MRRRVYCAPSPAASIKPPYWAEYTTSWRGFRCRLDMVTTEIAQYGRRRTLRLTSGRGEPWLNIRSSGDFLAVLHFSRLIPALENRRTQTSTGNHLGETSGPIYGSLRPYELRGWTNVA